MQRTRILFLSALCCSAALHATHAPMQSLAKAAQAREARRKVAEEARNIVMALLPLCDQARVKFDGRNSGDDYLGLHCLSQMRLMLDRLAGEAPQLFDESRFVSGIKLKDAAIIRGALAHGWKDLRVELDGVPVFFELYNRRDLLQILIDAGLDINAKSSGGMSIFLYTACFMPLPPKPWGGPLAEMPEVVLNVARTAPIVESLHALCKLGADVNTVGELYGETALMRLAAYWDDERVSVFDTLIAIGASVNAQDKLGNTALMTAVHEGHEKAVKALLQHGADITIKNSGGISFEMLLTCDESTPELVDIDTANWCRRIYSQVQCEKKLLEHAVAHSQTTDDANQPKRVKFSETKEE